MSIGYKPLLTRIFTNRNDVTDVKTRAVLFNINKSKMFNVDVKSSPCVHTQKGYVVQCSLIS